MKLKFNLGKALAGKPVVTRLGCSATVDEVHDGRTFPLTVGISGHNTRAFYTIKGASWHNRKSDKDLFMYVDVWAIIKGYFS